MEKTSDNSAKLLKQVNISEEHFFSGGGQIHTQHKSAWVAINNNNNTFVETNKGGREKHDITKAKQQDDIVNAQTSWECESYNEAAVGDSNNSISCSKYPTLKANVDDGHAKDEHDGEHTQNGFNTIISNSRCNNSNALLEKSNSTTAMKALPTITTKDCNAEVVPTTSVDSRNYDDNEDDECCAGATSLTPLGAGVDLACGAADINSLHSNHTSINNSTENLSYSSDNYYPDDLILLDDDDDPDAEEISLNSDDCVYAYRGDGAEFDLSLDALTGRHLGSAGVGAGNNGLMDDGDEPDFLEMDFEPDPLSEVQNQMDDVTPPQKALQSQSILSKNFARITLHLDQIKGENGIDCDVYRRGDSAMSSGCAVGGSKHANDLTDFSKQSTAHSLPNTLHASFGRDVHEKQEIKTSPSKITGAKPKRLSTFSTSSSTSSKNSSKSRSSLRSTFVPPMCGGSSSFDERSVSCTEFRSAPASEENTACVSTCAPNPADDFNINDEACLDCLEKEFLANTIGKTMDHRDCAKCRNKRRLSSAYYARAEQARCRSGSPSFFADLHDDYIFDSSSSGDFPTNNQRRVADWTTHGKHDVANSFNNCKRTSIDSSMIRGDVNAKLIANNSDDIGSGNGVLMFMNEEHANQRRTKLCDTYNGGDEHLLTKLLRTEKEISTISILNLNEDTLVQALEKLHVSYNLELLKTHFKQNALPERNLHNQQPAKEFKSLKDFILHESKKHCNHPKLKRLIELATRQQVHVEFKQNSNVTETEMVNVKVSDILHQWARTKNLESLKQLDMRFINGNLLGKIANIIRQAQQRCSSRRPLPESISIPQYYPSGLLTLTKNC